MVQKRPFDGEESNELFPKLPRHEKHCNQGSWLPETPLFKDLPFICNSTGEDLFTESKVKNDEKFSSNNNARLPTSHVEETEYSDDDTQLDQLFHRPFSPEYFYPEYPPRTVTRRDDAYSFLLQQPPRKLVPIGPNYQADIPAWLGSHTNRSWNDVDKLDENFGEYDKRLGVPVISASIFELHEDDGYKIGTGNLDCSCKDRGSIRCVRQHVIEASNKLRKTLGEEIFEELCLHDMGEQVAEKWSTEEEQLFHDIVFSNPPSENQNFWDSLSYAFPCRTKNEIVSYYYNVFMLRRRAKQNRCEPENVDSDNDEWQSSDDEEEDSAVESPDYQFGHGYIDNLEEDVNGWNDDITDETCEDDIKATLPAGKDFPGLPEACEGKWLGGVVAQVDDAGDDSCTSFENLSEVEWKNGNDDHWAGSFGVLNGGCGDDYTLEHCDAKLWDTRYMGCSDTQHDFLPTYSVIEEVLGDGSWNFEEDGKGFR